MKSTEQTYYFKRKKLSQKRMKTKNSCYCISTSTTRIPLILCSNPVCLHFTELLKTTSVWIPVCCTGRKSTELNQNCTKTMRQDLKLHNINYYADTILVLKLTGICLIWSILLVLLRIQQITGSLRY